MSVHVRFAPSPTGLLHPGNARVAMQNYLFSLHHNGQFLLRIDDTDTQRSSQHFIDKICQDLKWLGIDYHRVIYQSQRHHLYEQAKDTLIKSGRLYPCYETPEELEEERQWQRKIGKPPIYSRTSLKLTDAEKEQKEASGVRPHWRFLLPDSSITWRDMCKGERRVHLSNTSDPVLIRANGTLTFLLASVVDDIDENITHIIRGDDHISNTATHIALEYALSQTSESRFIFGHTPLLHADKGFVLSKSAQSSSLDQLRSQGLLPETLWTYLISLGAPKPITHFESVSTMAQDFNIARYSQASPLFDIHQVWQRNSDYLRDKKYTNLPPDFQSICSPDLWACIYENVRDIEQAQEWVQRFQTTCHDVQLTPEHLQILQSIYLALKSQPDSLNWSEVLPQIHAQSQKPAKVFFTPLRLALMGVAYGPKVATCAHFIGLKGVLERLENVLCNYNYLTPDQTQ